MNILWVIIVVLLVLVLFGGVAGYRVGWGGHPYGGYYSGGIGIVGVILIVLVIMLLMGRL
jgi:hypothetical protein